MKGTTIFAVLTLGGAIMTYNVNAFVSLVCLLLFIGCAYGAGKLG